MLHHRCSGEGEPLVLLHGLFGSLENLGAIARHLAKQYRVYSVDLPNHGRSPHIDNAGLAAMARELASWMDAQALASAHIIGHSLGGKVAMELALQQPQRVEKLVVIDIAPVAYPPRHDDVFAGLNAIDTAALQQRQQADALLSDYVQEPAVRTFLLKNLSKAESGFAWRLNLHELERSYAQLIAANHSGCFDKPVLFLKGADSDYISAAYKDEIMQRFPRAQLRVVDNTAHWLHAEKPELVSKLITRFLGS